MTIILPRQDFVDGVAALAPSDGTHATALSGVLAIRTSHPMGRMPVLYDSGLAMIAQGRKRGFIGGQMYEYSQDTYLVLASPLPLEVELIEASPEKPLLCLFLAVDGPMLGSLAADLDRLNGASARLPVAPPPRAVYATPLDDQILDAARRLVRALLHPVDAHILADGIRREVLYRALLGPQADALRALLGRDSAAARIARVLQCLHGTPKRAMTVAEMADMAGMSVSAFHAAFKAATSLAPIQYQKAVRLHRAQALIAFDGRRVSDAAYAVGYASASQFSRDYRRLFGVPPSQGVREELATVE